MFRQMRMLLHVLAVEGILTAAVKAQLLGECMRLSGLQDAMSSINMHKRNYYDVLCVFTNRPR